MANNAPLNEGTTKLLNFKDFKDNPLLFLLFLPLFGLVFYVVTDNKKNDKQVEYLLNEINDLKNQNRQKDSITHILYYKLGAKEVLETLKD